MGGFCLSGELDPRKEGVEGMLTCLSLFRMGCGLCSWGVMVLVGNAGDWWDTR